MSPFDFINAINDTKVDMFEDQMADKDYNSFIINKGLSYFPDTILFANEMNQRLDIPNKWKFNFLRYAIPKKRRFSKWHKKDSMSDDIELIKKHYKYSSKKAYEVASILSAAQIAEIRSEYATGGRNS